MIDFYVNSWRRYGDVVRFQIRARMHLIAHPDDVKRVLVDNEKNYAKGIGYRKIRQVLGNGLFTNEGSRGAGTGGSCSRRSRRGPSSSSPRR